MNAECTLAITTSSCARAESVQVERAVGQDVDLYARQDGDAVDLLAGAAKPLRVLDGPLLVEPIGERQVLGVLGDGDVLVAALAGGQRHFFDGATAIGFHRVHVNFAANVFDA